MGLILAGIVVSCAPAFDFIAEQFVLPTDGVRPATHTVEIKRGQSFVARDGVTLLADIYRPLGLATMPTILVRIPLTRTASNQIRADVIARYWAKRGYTVVIQGTRGRYGSGGEFYPLIHERADGLETLKWLQDQEWFDGRLAMWGGSSFGHTQWSVADQVSPGASALHVHIVSTNFRRMFFPGEAFALESALYWTIRSRGAEDRTVDVGDLERAVRTLPVHEADDRAIGDTEFYNDWLRHKDNREFWEAIDGRDRAQTLQAPILLLAGWYDPFLPGQLDDFKVIADRTTSSVGSKSRLIVGPWGHATSIRVPGMETEIPYRESTLESSLPWFDFHLKVTTDRLTMSRVRLFVMGENRWRDEQEWPLARTVYTPYYFHSAGHANTVEGDGRLKGEVPTEDEASDQYVYDPLDPVPTRGGAMLGDRSGIITQNEVESRNDVLVYSTAALTKPLEVTGPLHAVLYVGTDAPSTDFTVKLVDVHPDGVAYNVSDGILRREYPRAVDSGREPIEIKVELGPTSHVFLAGHRLRVEVSSSNFPRFDRNLNTGKDPSLAIKAQVAHQVFFHQATYPSHILLPIIPR
ncbi:MAG: CocE/NonD family hydrolase [Nitrospira sp.]|nr:CocE/NonD family hydrolase [Nitrospira sp.]MBH0197785.1 CocE/NonD family hydrolase [Nitrospira sp.]